MFSWQMNTSIQAEINALFGELKDATPKNTSKIHVRPGQEINRYLKGCIFMLDGVAQLYQSYGERQVFLDRYDAGRLFVDSAFDEQTNESLTLVAETPCEIGVVNLRELKVLQAALQEKFFSALSRELYNSCIVAREKICALRFHSPRERFLAAVDLAFKGSKAAHDPSGWSPLPVDTNTVLAMSDLSLRQFRRILPELVEENVVRAFNDSIEINTGNQ